MTLYAPAFVLYLVKCFFALLYYILQEIVTNIYLALITLSYRN
jgi:hypothetical protein